MTQKDKGYYMAIPDWLKEVKDDKIFGAIGALLFDWGYNETQDVEGLHTKLTTTFELSDEQADKAIELLKTNKVLQ